MGRRRPWSLARALLAVLAVGTIVGSPIAVARARRFVLIWEHVADTWRESGRFG